MLRGIRYGELSGVGGGSFKREVTFEFPMDFMGWLREQLDPVQVISGLLRSAGTQQPGEWHIGKGTLGRGWSSCKLCQNV